MTPDTVREAALRGQPIDVDAILEAVENLRNSGPLKLKEYHMKVKVWVEDEEFGEHFQADVNLGDLIVGLKNAPVVTVDRVPDGDGRVKLPDPGVWLCVRVGDE